MRTAHLLVLVPLTSILAPAQEEVRFENAFPAQKAFERPVYLDWHASDPDHYWVLEQTGRVLRIPRDGESDERHVALDLGDDCLDFENGGHNEEGLLGFAFAPGYGERNRDVFVYWSHAKSREGRKIERESVLSRFTVEDTEHGPVIDRDSELEVMTIDQPWGNHNGGTLIFGPDEMLYVALGDGGARADMGGNGQNLRTLLATILRIDVRGASAEEPYRVPDDNPFVGREDARGEIWAYGLRNPWRISFDRETNQLWCADVGQDLWEEVGPIERGGNYGWPLYEGFHVFPPDREGTEDDPDDLKWPIAEYSHKGEGISVTGGYVYRGARLPWLVGRYVYGDFAFRTVWAVDADREPPSDGAEAPHDALEIGKAPSALASFAEEPDGEHLALCFDGKIYRLVPAGD